MRLRTRAAVAASAAGLLAVVAMAPGASAAAGPVGEAGAIVGPVIITTAPSLFVNANNQITAGGAGMGVQVAGP
jgi:hypothetical protein